MKIPRITIKFDSFLRETEKAILISFQGKDMWLPKALCSDIHIRGGQNLNGTGGAGTLNIAPFKFQEMTGIIPQSIDSLVIDDIAENLKLNQIDSYDIAPPRGIVLREKQLEKINKIKRLKHFFVYGQMRTGKTVIAVTVAQSRLKANIINKIIVIAPLRTKSVWEKHFETTFDFYAVEHFSNQNTRDKLNIICDEKTMVILDESHKIKNQNTYRTEYILKLTSEAGQRCILTGTPIGKHAGDLFFQFFYLDQGILNFAAYGDFEKTHLLYGGRDGKKVVAYTNIEEISKKISPYTVKMSRKEMGIDREKIYTIETYSISNSEKYEDLKKKYEDLYDKNKTIPILGYMVKLQQCANGYEINDEDECVGYADNGRTECVKKILEKHKENQVVIYFKYNDDLKSLSELNIPILCGKTKQKDFDDTIEKFNEKKIKIIALQQQISIGFSLRACDVMIYFSRAFGSITSAQSEDRACENAEKPLQIIDVCGRGTIDEAIKRTIEKQFDVINLFKKELRNENKQ